MDRRLTTIVAADLAGYSRLMAMDEEGAILRLRSARSELIDPAIRGAGGRIVKTMGDGLLVEFPSPVSAVRVAVDVQNAMAERETGPEDDRLRFRIGINLSDVIDDDDDILGDGVNVAARLESLAHPGGICISRAVFDQLRGKIGPPMTAIGPQMVKNMPEPIDVWRIELEGARPATVRQDTDRPSVAVLPFENLSIDPDQDFLADGIAEDLITELSRFGGLFVIGRNSTFAYKGTHKDVREIAAELGVRYVVEGSVRRGGNRLRLVAQLIEAATGAHVWADRFDRKMEDIFDLQDELTSTLVARIEPEIGAHERTLSRRKPTGNLNAWELYHRGITEFFAFHDPDRFNRAEDLLRKAADADTSFPLPLAFLARLHWLEIATGRSDDRRANISKGLEYGRRAVEMDDRQEIAQAAYGQVLILAGRADEGRQALRRALALNPNNGFVHITNALAEIFAETPDTNLMAESARKALALDPNSLHQWGAHTIIGHAALWRTFDWTDDAVRAAYEAAAASPSVDFFPPFYAALANAQSDRLGAAARYLAQSRSLRPGLTAEIWRSVFDFPMFARMVETSEAGLAKLVALGLPER